MHIFGLGLQMETFIMFCESFSKSLYYKNTGGIFFSCNIQDAASDEDVLLKVGQGILSHGVTRLKVILC